MTSAKALFLDRDGVINVEYNYVHAQEQFEFIPGIHELVSAAHAKGYKVFVVTNQAGIGRGMYTEEQFASLMAWVQKQLPYDAHYYCPYHPEHGIGRYKLDSPDRKPQPGMILRAAAEHGIDLSQSILIGDRETDIEAAKNAGIRTKILFSTAQSATGADATITRLSDAEAFL